MNFSLSKIWIVEVYIFLHVSTIFSIKIFVFLHPISDIYDKIQKLNDKNNHQSNNQNNNCYKQKIIMIGKISRGLIRSSLLKSQQRFSNFLDKSNFIQAKYEAEVSPPASQLNKNYYNPEYRYDT